MYDYAEKSINTRFISSGTCCFHWILLPFMRRRRYQVNMRRMVAQIAGCSITAEAWRPAGRLDGAQPDLSDTFHFLYEEVESYLEEKKRNFNELVQKKWVLYSIEKELAIA